MRPILVIFLIAMSYQLINASFIEDFHLRTAKLITQQTSVFEKDNLL